MVTDFDGPVPVLMYHAIAEAPAGSAYPELFVPRRVFGAQVRALEDAGFHAVTLDSVLAAWQDGAPIAENPVVLSFDDGIRSQFTEALPILSRRFWPGVLNLKVEALDQGELDDAMVNEMIDSGWELDAHTLSHPDLTELDPDSLEREVAESRRDLATRFGQPVNFLCYPGGRFNEEVIAVAKRAGYRGATTTQPGLAEPGADPFRLNRIRVDASDGVEGVIAKLRAQGVDV